MAKALESNTTLQHLSLAMNEIGDVGALALAKALESNTTLQRLSVVANEIGDVGAQALAQALEKNSTLQELQLDMNLIGDDGAQTLAQALKTNATLKCLGLSLNPIYCEGVQALDKAVQINTTLQSSIFKPSHDVFITRNRRLKEVCADRENLLVQTKSVAVVMCLLELPIYVLLDIVKWKLVLQMIKIEMECVGRRFVSTSSHWKRVESLDQHRLQILESIQRRNE